MALRVAVTYRASGVPIFAWRAQIVLDLGQSLSVPTDDDNFAAMQDLTTSSITRHLLKTMSFMLVMMIFQTLYVLVDLYWVGRLGTSAVAAVGIAGNLTFVVLALTQMLGVGTTTVVAHAIGRRDHA